MVKQMSKTIHQTHTNTSEALSLLHDLTAPATDEGPSQISEILTTLTAIAESQARMERRQEQLEQKIVSFLRALQSSSV